MYQILCILVRLGVPKAFTVHPIRVFSVQDGNVHMIPVSGRKKDMKTISTAFGTSRPFPALMANDWENAQPSNHSFTTPASGSLGSCQKTAPFRSRPPHVRRL
jgi:hypothetical protein